MRGEKLRRGREELLRVSSIYRALNDMMLSYFLRSHVLGILK